MPRHAAYFLKHMSEVLDKFKEFEAFTTNECGHSAETLRTDNGSEYLSIYWSQCSHMLSIQFHTCDDLLDKHVPVVKTGFNRSF